MHLVFKVDRSRLRLRSLRSPQSFSLIQLLVKKYSTRFYIRVEQISIQGDHIHMLVRTPRRSQFQYFFRVLAGQIAQQFKQESWLNLQPVTDTHTKLKKGTAKRPSAGWLWKHRPFSRVVRGFKGHQIVRNYIQLNEKEALGHIQYQKERLRGLSTADWEILWT